jgi:hypothetical protein
MSTNIVVLRSGSEMMRKEAAAVRDLLGVTTDSGLFERTSKAPRSKSMQSCSSSCSTSPRVEGYTLASAARGVGTPAMAV